MPAPTDNTAQLDRVLPLSRFLSRQIESRPEIGEENFAHLERYLRFGAYSRTRQPLIKRFVAQLGQVA